MIPPMPDWQSLSVFWLSGGSGGQCVEPAPRAMAVGRRRQRATQAAALAGLGYQADTGLPEMESAALHAAWLRYPAQSLSKFRC